MKNVNSILGRRICEVAPYVLHLLQLFRQKTAEVWRDELVDNLERMPSPCQLNTKYS